MQTPPLSHRRVTHGLLLLVWIGIGFSLRFTNLESKPPWADEWATIVFSLGHSFLTVPLDRLISVEALLQPLQLDAATQPGDTIAHLMAESTHPPLYFVLTHLWLKLLSPDQELVSIWGVRSLSALLGTASIPALFGLGWLARSRLIGQMAAALMAVSPYGIYLAQEARHYTLAILWIVASLCCLLTAVRHVRRGKALPVWIVLLWIVVNSLGIATHYFFALTLGGEMLVLLPFWLREASPTKSKVFAPHWTRIYAAIAGTLISGSIWLSAWRSIPDSNLTSWIYQGNPWGSEFFEPIARLLAWIVTMLFLLPVEGTPLPLTVASGLIVLLVLLWLTPALIRCWRVQVQQSSSLATVLGGFVIGAIALILTITYTLGTDLTLAARYHFVYFPAFLVLVGTALAQIWQETKTSQQQASKFRFQARGKRAVVIVLLMSLLGGLTVVTNFGYQKADRPDLVVPVILEAHRLAPEAPVLIATAHKNHEQTGEMMGLAWELQHSRQPLSSFQFLLAHKPDDTGVSAQTLYQSLAQLPRPFQLWLTNFSESTDLDKVNCQANSDFKRQAPGYRYRLYYCSD